MKLKIIVHNAPEGGFWAEVPAIAGCMTQGDTWEDLRKQVKDAVDGYFFDQPKPETIHLHFVRVEILASA